MKSSPSLLLSICTFKDILHWDIVARHEIRDVANLHNLAVYLLTNNARLTSVNKIKANFSISQDKAENYLIT